jgi:hypothetical protein
MLRVTKTTIQTTLEICDDSGKWVGNVVGSDGAWSAEHMRPVIIDGKHHGQWAPCHRLLCSSNQIPFSLQDSAIGHLADCEALHGVALPKL